jgi:hypothetical protein
LNVSEPQAEQISGEPGSMSVGPSASHSSDTQNPPVTGSAEQSMQESIPASMQELLNASSDVETPKLAPEQDEAGETSEVNAPKVDFPKVDFPNANVPNSDAPNTDASKADAPEADAPPSVGYVMPMSSGDHTSDSEGVGAEPKFEQGQGILGKRRLAVRAAVVALAVTAGALGGALVTAAFQHSAGDDAATSANRALEASVARIDADIVALKASVERTAKLGMSQFGKASDRLDKVERAQQEPAAKLAKLSEAVDKLRAAAAQAQAPVTAASVAAKDVTGSIAPKVAPKIEVARLPTVEGWVLRDVANGAAMIENRQGMYEVYAGDAVPGLGRVDAIRRQDGRWVVVTSKGLVVAR